MTLRCAIYTRKSSEEGLDQSFNSLHAQREACEAYIRSQVGEGWSVIRERYDDGGFSGGSIERPALKRLLSDVTSGRVGAVVVYKVDRLTRSIADFGRIIEALDRKHVSFVSVTQAFNTTNSMGRLTLNVLLSFAQFERDVTGERIRDKIAASKAKGMWMGGVPPLGYDPPGPKSDRALRLNEAEARTVRFIFQMFLRAPNLGRLQLALLDEGVRSKRWVTEAGQSVGGFVYTRGALRHLLQNRVYLGEITHKGQSFPGRHPAILGKATFDAVQALMRDNSVRRRTFVSNAKKSLLYGLLFDADGAPMEFLVVTRRRRRYAYYASKPLPGRSGEETIRRVRASAIEDVVRDRLAQLLDEPMGDIDAVRCRDVLHRIEIYPTQLHLVLRAGIQTRSGRAVMPETLRGSLGPGEDVQAELGDRRRLRLVLPVRMKAWGGRSWVQSSTGEVMTPPAAPDTKLVRRIQRANAILKRCGFGPEGPVAPSANLQGALTPYELRQVQWAFLAPDIQAAIFEGRWQGDWRRLARSPIPLGWSDQRALFNVHSMTERSVAAAHCRAGEQYGCAD